MGREPEISETPCKECGETGYSLNFIHWKKLVEAQLCFGCDYWVSLLAKPPEGGDRVVIDGCHYVAGNGYGSRDCGMSGRRFDIEFNDGRRVTCYDLWHQGAIPDRFKDRAPDNAKFLNGGERVASSGYTAFDPSSNATEPYPLPNGSKGPPWSPAPTVWVPIIGQFAKEFAS
jgi:hypothetical protein